MGVDLCVCVRSCVCVCAWRSQEVRKGFQDTSLQEATASVTVVSRVQLKTRKTLRGHLAKIYAMHWGTESK